MNLTENPRENPSEDNLVFLPPVMVGRFHSSFKIFPLATMVIRIFFANTVSELLLSMGLPVNKHSALSKAMKERDVPIKAIQAIRVTYQRKYSISTFESCLRKADFITKFLHFVMICRESPDIETINNNNSSKRYTKFLEEVKKKFGMTANDIFVIVQENSKYMQWNVYVEEEKLFNVPMNQVSSSKCEFFSGDSMRDNEKNLSKGYESDGDGRRNSKEFYQYTNSEMDIVSSYDSTDSQQVIYDVSTSRSYDYLDPKSLAKLIIAVFLTDSLEESIELLNYSADMTQHLIQHLTVKAFGLFSIKDNIDYLQEYCKNDGKNSDWCLNNAITYLSTNPAGTLIFLTQYFYNNSFNQNIQIGSAQDALDLNMKMFWGMNLSEIRDLIEMLLVRRYLKEEEPNSSISSTSVLPPGTLFRSYPSSSRVSTESDNSHQEQQREDFGYTGAIDLGSGR